jgi:hypothetical protein
MDLSPSLLVPLLEWVLVTLLAEVMRLSGTRPGGLKGYSVSIFFRPSSQLFFINSIGN